MEFRAFYRMLVGLLAVSLSCNFINQNPPATAGNSTAGPTLHPAPTSLPAIDVENLDQLERLHAYGNVFAQLFGVSSLPDLNRVAYSRDGRYVALGGCTEYFNGGDSGRLYCGRSDDPTDDESAKSFTLIVDAATEELIASLPDNEPDTTVTDLAFTHDGSKLFITLYHPDRSELAVWDMAAQQVESELWEDLGYPAIDLSADDHWLALDNGFPDESNGKIEVFDLTNDAVIAELPGGFWAPQFSTDGRKLAAAPPDKFSIYDTGTWTLASSIGPPCKRCYVALSPDLALLATSDANQQHAPVLIWDIASGQQLQSLSAGENDPSFLYFTPDGSMLWDFMVLDLAVWDTANWQLVQRQDPLGPIIPIEQGSGPPRAVHFAGDGRTFLLLTELDIYLVGVRE